MAVDTASPPTPAEALQILRDQWRIAGPADREVIAEHGRALQVVIDGSASAGRRWSCDTRDLARLRAAFPRRRRADPGAAAPRRARRGAILDGTPTFSALLLALAQMVAQGVASTRLTLDEFLTLQVDVTLDAARNDR